ncbi:MAG: hypothetical protein ACP5PJ_10330, partial [Acidimicrobiales bacterium]
VIHIVALVNAEEESGEDPDGEAWLAWRRGHEDGGRGCVGVAGNALRALELLLEEEHEREFVSEIERIVMEDHNGKAQLQ